MGESFKYIPHTLLVVCYLITGHHVSNVLICFDPTMPTNQMIDRLIRNSLLFLYRIDGIRNVFETTFLESSLLLNLHLSSYIFHTISDMTQGLLTLTSYLIQ